MPLDNLQLRNDDSNDNIKNSFARNNSNPLKAINSSSRFNDGSRIVKPEVLTSALKFSPNGNEFSVASTQGLQLFSLDELLLFAPTDLDISITPTEVLKRLAHQEYTLAINMALQLNERNLLKQVVDSVKYENVEFVVKSIDVRMLKTLLQFFAEELVSSNAFLLLSVVVVICHHYHHQ